MRTIGFETFLPWTTLFNVLRDMKNSNPNINSLVRLNYIKHLALKSLLFILLVSCVRAQNTQAVTMDSSLKVGAERIELYINKLEGKSVGFVGNQTSVIGVKHAVDTLLSRGVNIVRVYSPEHGFRGTADAGELVKGNIDQKTGLPVYSLYGKQKKPSPESLKDIDVMLFDIQDVGVRFYTYISTLHYVMEACAEMDIPVIILDRPNPNGHYVDGPVLDTNFRSFVGMHPVPTVHGMTIGEYGLMINGEGWLPKGLICDLTVIPIQNYTHEMKYSLRIPPSPNLRSDQAIQLYPSLCLLEATSVSIGRGTDGPFERYGHPDFPKTDFSFTPKSGFGSKSPKHEGKLCYGYNLKDSVDRMHELDIYYLIHAHKLLGPSIFIGKESSFNLLAGNGEMVKQVQLGMSKEEIEATWEPALSNYKEKTRPKYLLYP